MKKILLFALMVTAIATISQVANGKKNAEPKNTSINISDEWTHKATRGYDGYGNYIHEIEAMIKSTPSGLIIKARMTGFRYDNDEWFSVTKGNYKCGENTYKYRVYQWESYLYFNL